MDDSIPALDRAILLLELIEAAPDGITAATLLEQAKIPRTTLFRILRILCAKGFVAARGDDTRTYALGPALVRLAARVPVQDGLVAAAGPVMEALSAKVGQTVKLVVREGLETVSVAVREPAADAHIATRLGMRLPLNIGAGQRLLLAHAPAETQRAFLAGPLERRASDTLHRVTELRRDIAALRDLDSAIGGSEGNEGVGTVAALVHEPGRAVRAALIVLFILGGRSRREVEAYRLEVVAAAQALAARLQRAAGARSA